MEGSYILQVSPVLSPSVVAPPLMKTEQTVPMALRFAGLEFQ